MRSRWLTRQVERWTGLLIGRELPQRMRASQSLFALMTYVLFALGQQVEVRLGLVDADRAHLLAAVLLGGAALFYGLVRSGWNQRLRDPSMTFVQIFFALTLNTWAYAITGPARGALLSVSALILLFATFKLTSRQSIGLALYSFFSLAAVMAWRSQTDPAAYDPRVEAVHLIFAAIILSGTGALLTRLVRLRQRLLQQRRELSEALERIRLLATRDELTGLPNRRALLDALALETARQARAAPLSAPLALVLIDLDHFKRVNDQFGHAVGDAVLRGFAERASAGLRATDMLARWGGEEFLLMLPATSAEQALLCVERLRERLRAEPLLQAPLIPQPALYVTFSAGVSVCEGTADLHPAIDRADQAMYRAKSGGRDRAERG